MSSLHLVTDYHHELLTIEFEKIKSKSSVVFPLKSHTLSFLTIQDFLDDPSPNVRATAVHGVFQITALYWEWIPAHIVKELITKIVSRKRKGPGWANHPFIFTRSRKLIKGASGSRHKQYMSDQGTRLRFYGGRKTGEHAGSTGETNFLLRISAVSGNALTVNAIRALPTKYHGKHFSLTK